MIRRSQQLRSQLKAPRERLPGGSRRWIRSSMDWLVAEFGRDVLLRPIALPTDVIPDGYDGSTAAAVELCARVDDRMDLRLGQCALSFELNGVRRAVNRLVVKESHGRWIRGDGQNRIQLAPALVADPVAPAAIYAHEAGHELLLGGGRISLERHPEWDRHLDPPVRRGMRNQLVVLHR